MAGSSSIIIGIHGLSNKPPHPPKHGNDWKAAIIEGLARNHSLTVPESALPFALLYWRDWNYQEPLDPDPEPYEKDGSTGPFPAYQQHWPDILLGEALKWAAKPLDWAKEHLGVDLLADAVLERRLQDLSIYYENEARRRDLRQRLYNVLKEHGSKQIVLLAHSMGSIIAYDVLRELGKDIPTFKVAHFVTLGSPLGLPHVLYRIRQEHVTLRTPSIVARWSNFADRRDPIAADVHLADDYDANALGVQVQDQLVLNTYERDGKRNPHKIWGYLRAPEVTSVLKTFI